MPLYVLCHDCTVWLNAADEHAGGLIKCPKCSSLLRVPELNEELEVQETFTTDALLDDEIQEVVAPARHASSRLRWPVAVGSVTVLIVFVGCVFLWNRSHPAPNSNEPAIAAPTPVVPANDGKRPEVATPSVVKVSPSETSSPVPVGQPPQIVLEGGGHTARVHLVAFTPDSKRVVTASRDNSIRVWDVTTGESLQTIRLPFVSGREDVVQAIAVSPDGKMIAVGMGPHEKTAKECPLYLIHLEAERVLKTLPGLTSAVTALAFSGDGRLLASGGTDRTVIVWGVKDWKPVAKLPIRGDTVVSVAFSPDGRRLACVDNDSGTWLWAGDPSVPPAELRDSGHRPRSVTWSADGKTIAAGNRDGTISLWESDGNYRDTLLGTLEDVHSVSLSPDGREILQTGLAKTKEEGERFVTSLIDLTTGESRRHFGDPSKVFLAGVLSSDGTHVVTVGKNDREPFVWHSGDATADLSLSSKARSLWSVGWSRDGQSIAWGTTNIGIGWKNGTPLEHTFHLGRLSLEGPPETPFSRAVLAQNDCTLNLAPDGELVFQHPRRPELRFCDRSTSRDDRVNCFSFLQDGTILVGQASGLFLLDSAGKHILRRYVGHTDAIHAIAPSPDGRRFVTASADRTVKIWNVTDERPVLSLFTVGRNWIAWTEGGFYAASPGGERLMGWQVSTDGPAGFGLWFPCTQFRRSLDRPEVLSRIVRMGSVPAALADAGLPVDAQVNVSEAIPPEVEITSPAGMGSVRMNGKRFEVAATARAKGTYPVTGMRLLVNGRPYGGESDIRAVTAEKGGDSRATWSVELPAGTYSLVVVAESKVSHAVSPRVEVVIPDSGGDPRPALYLLAIGIDDGPRRIGFASTDAETIAEVFRNQEGKIFRSVNVKLMTNKRGTKKAIDAGLDWLADTMTHQDVGIVFFSGHSIREPDELYLAGAGVDLEDMPGTCLSGTSLKKQLARTCGRVIAMLDVCRASRAMPERPVSTDDLIRTLVSENCGVVVMSAASSSEYSQEETRAGLGYFTLAIVEGLTGAADRNGDGVVDLNELDAFTSRRVSQLTQSRQNPLTVRPSTVPTFPLSRR